MGHLLVCGSASLTEEDTRALKEEAPTSRVVVDDLSPHSDRAWLQVLQYGDIVDLRPIRSQVAGLADKWRARFSSGEEAMIKLVETWSFLPKQWPTRVRKTSPLHKVLIRANRRHPTCWNKELLCSERTGSCKAPKRLLASTWIESLDSIVNLLLWVATSHPISCLGALLDSMASDSVSSALQALTGTFRGP